MQDRSKKITEVDFGRKETNLEVDKLSYSKENAVGLQYLIEDQMNQKKEHWNCEDRSSEIFQLEKVNNGEGIGGAF